MIRLDKTYPRGPQQGPGITTTWDGDRDDDLQIRSATSSFVMNGDSCTTKSPRIFSVDHSSQAFFPLLSVLVYFGIFVSIPAFFISCNIVACSSSWFARVVYVFSNNPRNLSIKFQYFWSFSATKIINMEWSIIFEASTWNSPFLFCEITVFPVSYTHLTLPTKA